MGGPGYVEGEGGQRVGKSRKGESGQGEGESRERQSRRAKRKRREAERSLSLFFLFALLPFKRGPKDHCQRTRLPERERFTALN